MKNYPMITIQSSQQPLSVQSRQTKKSKCKNKEKKPLKSRKQSYNSSSSSQFDQSKCLPENIPVLNFYDMKECQICSSSQSSRDMLLCDKCQDGYHSYCLNYAVDREANMFICPQCQKQEIQASQMAKDIELQIIQQIQKNCESCKKSLQNSIAENVQFGQQFETVQICFEDQFQNQKCLYCKKVFHYDCFNIRTNALNCSNCEKQIRLKCPKGHTKFLSYYKDKYKNFNYKKYLTLKPLQFNQRPKKHQRYPKINLKLPAPVTNWQFITQYQASIYYAFQTKRLNFIEDQIYDDQQVMNLNKWNGEFMPIFQLHQDDQKAFEIFKENTTNGVIVGPYEIKQDKIKGFHIVATDFIQKMTIITEYVGQVVTARRSLFHHKNNDSIFSLIKNPHSYLSLDIVPQSFGNISRFFSGINNKKSESRKALNVQAKKFSYKGRVRIIFYALKDIQAGDELFYDYNGGLFHEYPTDNFKV